MQVEDIKEYSTKIKRTEEEIAKGIIGQRNVIHHISLAILADGNVLLEGVPGLGKTQLVKTLAKVMDLNFSRIQFTPDLMPTDITGTNLIIKEGDRSRFQFEKGPVFANLVLADEINRATPKTQSALLEAMQEKTEQLEIIRMNSQNLIWFLQRRIRLKMKVPIRFRRHSWIVFYLSY